MAEGLIHNIDPADAAHWDRIRAEKPFEKMLEVVRAQVRANPSTSERIEKLTEENQGLRKRIAEMEFKSAENAVTDLDPEIVEAALAAARGLSLKQIIEAALAASTSLIAAKARAQALEEAAKVAEQAYGGKAHTYASENAELYRAQDAACAKIAARIRRALISSTQEKQEET